MELIPVRSSNLCAVGYEPSTSLLVVRFHSGRLYEYYRVPSVIHAGLLRASSRGEFFCANIRSRFHYRRIQ